MSTDGRPIATITPGVAIYVTALLEYVAEYVLQNVARVIERDNSDEASLSDLIKALEEDEGSSFWWSKMETKAEMTTEDKTGGKNKVQRPWQVPDASELDEAAGRKKFNRQSLGGPNTAGSAQRSGTPMGAAHSGAVTPSVAHERNSSQATDFHNGDGTGSTAASQPQQTHGTGTAFHTNSGDGPNLKRRPSFDKAAWFLGRRRGSFRSSQDLSGLHLGGARPSTSGTVEGGTSNASDSLPSTFGEPEGDDFDSLVMSGQTMKVSLTPNRLRAMNTGSNDAEQDGKRSSRRRPGTTTTALRSDALTTGFPATMRNVSSPTPSTLSGTQKVLPPVANAEDEKSSSRPTSRAGSVSASRPSMSRLPSKAAPPSAYRGPENEIRSTSRGSIDLNTYGRHDVDDVDSSAPKRTTKSKDVATMMGGKIVDGKLLPSDDPRPSNVREMIDLFSKTPPSPATQTFSNGRESRQSLASQVSTDTTTRRSGLGGAAGKVFGLFGRKSSVSSIPSPTTEVSRRNRNSVGMMSDSGITTHDTMSSITYPNGSETSHTSANKSGLHSPSALDASPAITSPEHRRRNVSGIITEEPNVDITRQTLDHQGSAEAGKADESSELHSSYEAFESASSLVRGNPTAPQERARTPNAGVYQDARGNASTSSLSSSHQHGRGTSDTQGRKVVPWSYNRPGSSGGRRLSAPNTGAVRIGSGSSSMGHTSDQMHNAPPSAWSQNGGIDALSSSATTITDPSHPRARTPTSGPLLYRSASPLQRQFGVSKTDTARVLVQLSQRMKEANSVEECQRLLTQALALTAAAVHDEVGPSVSSPIVTPSGGEGPENAPASVDSISSAARPATSMSLRDIPDEQSALDQHVSIKATSEGAGTHSNMAQKTPYVQPGVDRTTWQSLALPRPVRYRNIALPMAVGYDATEDDSLPLYRQQGIVAAWLLDGENSESEDIHFAASAATGTPHPTEAPASGEQELLKMEERRDSESTTGGNESDFMSADEQDGPQAARRRKSAAASAHAKHAASAASLPRTFASAHLSSAVQGGSGDDQDNRHSLVSSTNSMYRDAVDNTSPGHASEAVEVE